MHRPRHHHMLHSFLYGQQPRRPLRRLRAVAILYGVLLRPVLVLADVYNVWIDRRELCHWPAIQHCPAWFDDRPADLSIQMGIQSVQEQFHHRNSDYIRGAGNESMDVVAYEGYREQDC